jgi:hypothetical protein
MIEDKRLPNRKLYGFNSFFELNIHHDDCQNNEQNTNPLN